MNDEKFVEVKNLKKVYDNGHEAIKDVSFSVKKVTLYVCLAHLVVVKQPS